MKNHEDLTNTIADVIISKLIDFKEILLWRLPLKADAGK